MCPLTCSPPVSHPLLPLSTQDSQPPNPLTPAFSCPKQSIPLLTAYLQAQTQLKFPSLESMWKIVKGLHNSR